MKNKIGSIGAALALTVFSACSARAAEGGQNGFKTGIGYTDALILGLVEGVTEYIPVSSTGHLILTNALLNLDADTPLADADGAPVLDGEGNPYTVKSAADAYAVVIQLGAIAAVALAYRKSLSRMAMGVLGRDSGGLSLLINLAAAFLPAAAAGFFLHGAIERELFRVGPVAFALAAGAVFMFAVQKAYDKKFPRGESRLRLEDMTVRRALLVGVLQCAALWPGTSRSMVTIAGGYTVGLKPTDAAKFSFLLGLATLSAASVFKALKDGQNMLPALSCGPLAFGLLAAFAAAALSVKWLVGFLERRGLAPFAWYRLALAAALFLFRYAGYFA